MNIKIKFNELKRVATTYEITVSQEDLEMYNNGEIGFLTLIDRSIEHDCIDENKFGKESYELSYCDEDIKTPLQP